VDLTMHTEAPPNQASMDLNARRDLLTALRVARLVAFDFDGVFTDNTVWVDQNGVESVRCWRGDGLGLAALQRLGVQTVVISTEINPVVSVRCRKLGVACHQACEDKIGTLKGIVHEVGCTLEETVFVGNDINDIECLSAVGIPIVVADAHSDVLPVAVYTTRAQGGRGAVREICDLIRRAREGLGDDS
jgi:YrbI family 3-deoxy-D-manno-octulosonate 8-phosphate phosphatase